MNECMQWNHVQLTGIMPPAGIEPQTTRYVDHCLTELPGPLSKRLFFWSSVLRTKRINGGADAKITIVLYQMLSFLPGRVAQSVGHLTRKSGVLGSIPGLATYFRFSFRFLKKGSCQLLAKVCERSTG